MEDKKAIELVNAVAKHIYKLAYNTGFESGWAKCLAIENPEAPNYENSTIHRVSPYITEQIEENAKRYFEAPHFSWLVKNYINLLAPKETHSVQPSSTM